MAYCPQCKNNYQIVTSTQGTSYTTPVTTERYNSRGHHIGYETSETYGVDIKTLPRCSNCYSVFEFPNATSQEEFENAESEAFHLRRNSVIDKRRSLHTPKPSFGTFVFAQLFTILLIGVFLGGPIAFVAAGTLWGSTATWKGVITIWLFLTLAIGIAMYHFSGGYDKEVQEYEDRIRRNNIRIAELESLQYSHENYEKLKTLR